MSSIVNHMNPHSALAWLRDQLEEFEVESVAVSIVYKDDACNAAIFNFSARDLLWAAERLRSVAVDGINDDE